MRALLTSFCIALMLPFDAPAQGISSRLDDDYFLNGEKTLKAFAKASEMGLQSTVRFIRNEKVFILGTAVDARGYVVTKASEFESGEPFQAETPSGERLSAHLVSQDKTEDIALIKIPPNKVTAVEWKDTNAVFLGEWMAAPGKEGKEIRAGVISAKRRKITRRGGVIGIDLDPNDDAEELGVGIYRVHPGSPAKKVNMASGDLIVAVQDEKMYSVRQLGDMVSKYDAGDTLKFTVERGGENISVWATLEHRSRIFDKNDRNQQMSGVTSVRKAGFSDTIQTDLPLEPSEMGSPLLDIFGNVVGMNIAKADRVTTFALPSELVRRVVKELMPPTSGLKKTVPADEVQKDIEQKL
jgi:serine protease Do